MRECRKRFPIFGYQRRKNIDDSLRGFHVEEYVPPVLEGEADEGASDENEEGEDEESGVLINCIQLLYHCISSRHGVREFGV